MEKGAIGRQKLSYWPVGSVVHPDMRQLLPLTPEGVTDREGTEKQGCELSAAKRPLVKLRKTHPKPTFVAVDDGLYPNQPFITACEDQKMSFIPVAKPVDYKMLFEHLGKITAMGQGKS